MSDTKNEQVEVETSVEKEAPEVGASASPETQPNNLLFGTIRYDNDDAYEKFLAVMSPNQAVFVLIASANFAQQKGAYNILESEVLATAIRKIKKSSKKTETVPKEK